MREDMLELLRRAGYEGALGATNALSNMLGRKVYVNVLGLLALLPEDIPEILGGREKHVACVLSRLHGGYEGFTAFICPLRYAVKISLRIIEGLPPVGDIQEDAFRELGNIVIGNFISGIANNIGVKITYDEPLILIDTLGAVLDSVIALVSDECEVCYVYYLSFEGVDLKKAKLILIPKVVLHAP